jgi:hypothetical protein
MASSKLFSFARRFIDAGVFFPAANVCNFMQGGNLIADKVAIANLLCAFLLTGKAPAIEVSTQKIQNSILKFILHDFTNPLRLTSYSAFIISCLLLASTIQGSEAALFPSLAAFFFGIGNFIQSGPRITKFRSSLPARSVLKAITHPAIWYGLGYTATGIAIGGGMELLKAPFDHVIALLLTVIGIIEVIGFLGLMVSGTVANQAALFFGVAYGTLCFVISGIIAKNMPGTMAGLFACAGQITLAVKSQKLHNIPRMPSSTIERWLTAPLALFR